MVANSSTSRWLMNAGADSSPRYRRCVACIRWVSRTQRIWANMSLDSEISTSTLRLPGRGPRLRLAHPAGRPRRRDHDRAGTGLTAALDPAPRRYPAAVSRRGDREYAQQQADGGGDTFTP